MRPLASELSKQSPLSLAEHSVQSNSYQGNPYKANPGERDLTKPLNKYLLQLSSGFSRALYAVVRFSKGLWRLNSKP